MTPLHLPANGGMHLRERLWFATARQTAGHLVEFGFWEMARGAEQDSTAGFLNRELGSRGPRSRSAYVLRQDDLALGRKPRDLHR